MGFPFDPTGQGLVFNVLDYGADPTGVNDSTAAIQAAINAATANAGIVYSAPGTFKFTSQITANGSCGFAGPGVWKLGNSAYPNTAAGLVCLYLTGTNSTWTFYELHMDGNSANQSFTNATTNTFFKGVSADGNNGGTNGCTIMVPGILEFLNFTMLPTVGNGIGLNTFGCSYGDVNLLKSDNVDNTLWLTQASTTTPCDWNVEVVRAHNPTESVVYLEGFGGLALGMVDHLTDSLPAIDTGADTLRFLTANAIKNVSVGQLRTVYGRYPISGGAGGSNAISDTVISDCVAISCRGSYNLSQFDSSCSLQGLVADGCAIGGVSGASVFGDFEIGGGAASDRVIGVNWRSLNSANGSFHFIGPGTLIGGSVKNPTYPVGFASGTVEAECVIRDVVGYNPVGSQTAPTVPASGTALTNPFPFDCTVAVTDTSTGTSVAVGGITVATVPSGGTVPVFVGAGQTITLTYTTAPTWAWTGH